MKTPQYIVALHRKLKPNCNYEEFHQAWLPPGFEGKDPTKEALGYFKGPVQVINAVSMTDPTEIISIAVIWATLEEIAKDSERVQDTEQVRSDQVMQIADVSQEVKIYKIKDVNSLGSPLP